MNLGILYRRQGGEYPEASTFRDRVRRWYPKRWEHAQKVGTSIVENATSNPVSRRLPFADRGICTGAAPGDMARWALLNQHKLFFSKSLNPARLFSRGLPPIVKVLARHAVSLANNGKKGLAIGRKQHRSLRAHRRLLSGANLSQAYLSGIDLQGGALRATNLAKARLGGADLSGSDMRYARLEGAQMGKACLEGANLRGAYMAEANLAGARLSGAKFRGADMRDASLRGANLRNARLSHCQLDGADLANAKLGGATLRKVDLRHVSLGTPGKDFVNISAATRFKGAKMTEDQAADLCDALVAQGVAPEQINQVFAGANIGGRGKLFHAHAAATRAGARVQAGARGAYATAVYASAHARVEAEQVLASFGACAKSLARRLLPAPDTGTTLEPAGLEV